MNNFQSACRRIIPKVMMCERIQLKCKKYRTAKLWPLPYVILRIENWIKWHKLGYICSNISDIWYFTSMRCAIIHCKWLCGIIQQWCIAIILKNKPTIQQGKYVSFTLGTPMDYMLCVYNIHLIKCHRMHLQLTPSKFIYLIVCTRNQNNYSLQASQARTILCQYTHTHTFSA